MKIDNSETNIDATNENSVAGPKQKPDWMLALEQQSWQAELLVSGIAIFSALKLPGLVSELTDFLLAWLPNGMMGWLPYFITWYLVIGAVGLIACFVFHFVLRSFWIGLVGLTSVYPDGIRFRTDYLSSYMIDKLRKEYPNIDALSNKLDEQCSTIFAGTFFFLISVLGITLLIVVTLLASYALSLFLPFDVQTISAVIAVLLAGLSCLNSLLGSKAIREKAWVGKIHYPLSKLVSFLMFSIFAKSATQVALTFRTNAKSATHASIQSFFVPLIVMLIAIPTILNTNFREFFDERFVHSRSLRNVFYDDSYMDRRVSGKRILYPVIQSFDIGDNALQVFIPKLNRENDALAKLSAKWEKNKDLSWAENRAARSDHYLERAKKYYTLRVNDIQLKNLNIYEFTNSNAGEEGILIVVPSNRFQSGENGLEITRAYEDENGERSKVYIRFLSS